MGEESDNREEDLHHGPMMQGEQDPGSNGYGTPPSLWRSLAEPVDGFDLDPCSGAEGTPIAPTTYTEEEDGLRQAWHGDVFVNPPWSSDGSASAKEQWLKKSRAEANRDAVDSIVVLLPSDTSAGWFHEHVLAADILCFYGPGRLSFVGGDQNPSFGILIPVFGDDAEAYRDVLDSHGTVIKGREVYQPTVQTGLVAPTDQEDDDV